MSPNLDSRKGLKPNGSKPLQADNGSRTRDLYITNVALYHLSYISTMLLTASTIESYYMGGELSILFFFFGKVLKKFKYTRNLWQIFPK